MLIAYSQSNVTAIQLESKIHLFIQQFEFSIE